MAKARAPSPQWSRTQILAGFVRKTQRSQYNAQFPAGRVPARQENISTFPEAPSSASLLPAAYGAGRINPLIFAGIALLSILTLDPAHGCARASHNLGDESSVNKTWDC